MIQLVISALIMCAASGAHAAQLGDLSVDAVNLKAASIVNPAVAAPMSPVRFGDGPAPVWNFGGDNAWWYGEPGTTARARIDNLIAVAQACKSHNCSNPMSVVVGGYWRGELLKAFMGVTTEPDYHLDGVIERMAANVDGLRWKLDIIHQDAEIMSNWGMFPLIRNHARQLREHIQLAAGF